MTTGWFCESVCSPCCRAALKATAGGAVCVSCDADFSRRPYGLDLVPRDLPARHPAYSDWVNVQTALSAWRARTWNQSADAESRTRETERLASAFLELTAVGGRLLDVGCGSGWIAELLRARGAGCAGVDRRPSQRSTSFRLRGLYPTVFRFGTPPAIRCCSSRASTTVSTSTPRWPKLNGCWRRGGRRRRDADPLDPRGHRERLHHHRFLKGDVEGALAAVFGSKVRTYEWQPNYHFIWAIRS
jgi:Methyltransferase domain